MRACGACPRPPVSVVSCGCARAAARASRSRAPSLACLVGARGRAPLRTGARAHIRGSSLEYLRNLKSDQNLILRISFSNLILRISFSNQKSQIRMRRVRWGGSRRNARVAYRTITHTRRVTPVRGTAVPCKVVLVWFSLTTVNEKAHNTVRAQYASTIRRPKVHGGYTYSICTRVRRERRRAAL